MDNKQKETKHIDEQKHNPDYDKEVPNEVFDIEDGDEMAELYIDMFGIQ